MEKLSQEQLERASASRTLARIPVLNDPVITEAMAALNETASSTLPAGVARLANPCVEIFGPGPENRLCGECANLGARRQRMRLTTTGPLEEVTVYTCTFNVTARRVTAPACSRFVLALPPVASASPGATGGSPG